MLCITAPDSRMSSLGNFIPWKSGREDRYTILLVPDEKTEAKRPGGPPRIPELSLEEPGRDPLLSDSAARSFQQMVLQDLRCRERSSEAHLHLHKHTSQDAAVNLYKKRGLQSPWVSVMAESRAVRF